MGVWGISNLKNDTAKDWLVEIGHYVMTIFKDVTPHSRVIHL